MRFRCHEQPRYVYSRADLPRDRERPIYILEGGAQITVTATPRQVFDALLSGPIYTESALHLGAWIAKLRALGVPIATETERHLSLQGDGTRGRRKYYRLTSQVSLLHSDGGEDE